MVLLYERELMNWDNFFELKNQPNIESTCFYWSGFGRWIFNLFLEISLWTASNCFRFDLEPINLINNFDTLIKISDKQKENRRFLTLNSFHRNNLGMVKSLCAFFSDYERLKRINQKTFSFPLSVSVPSISPEDFLLNTFFFLWKQFEKKQSKRKIEQNAKKKKHLKNKRKRVHRPAGKGERN